MSIPAHLRPRHFREWRHAAAVYRERPVIIMLFLGFASGLPLALSFATLTVWLAEVGVSRTAIGLFAALGTPYALKFLWAPIIDRLALPPLTRMLGRRRGWTLATQLALMAALLGLGASDPAAAPGVTALAALAVAFCSASQDIVIDAYRVESLTPRQLAAGAAFQVFGYRIGMLVAGAGALYLATAFTWFTTYAVMAGLLGVGIVTVLVMPEPPGVAAEDEAAFGGRWATLLSARFGAGSPIARLGRWIATAVIAPFADFTGRRGWLIILLFVVFYKFGDSLAGVMTNPFLVEIGFTKIEIANIGKIFGFGATLLGLLLGGVLLSGTGMMVSLWVCGVLQLVSNLMFAAQAIIGADLGFLALTIGFENLAAGMGTAVFVAYLSSLCNIAYTATQYALFSSFMAVARTLLSSSAGALADWLDWTGFFILTAVAAVPGLVLLWIVTQLPPPAPTGARQ